MERGRLNGMTTISNELSPYATLIEELFNRFDLMLKHIIYDNYHALASYLALPLGLAITLSIVIMGLGILYGSINLSLEVLLKTSLKTTFIYLIALNWSFFGYYGVELISQSAANIAQVLVVQDKKDRLPVPHGNSLYLSLQSLFIRFTEVGAKVWCAASWHNLGFYFTALIIWGFSYVLVATALFELLLAKLMLALLFSMAPLFVSMMIFKVTHPSFDRWLSACLGFSFAIIFVSMILAVILNFSEWIVDKYYSKETLFVSMVGFAPVAFLGLLSIPLVGKVAELAQSLGGLTTTLSGSSLAKNSLQKGAQLFKRAFGGGGKEEKDKNNSTQLETSKNDSVSNSGQASMQAIRQNLQLPPPLPALPPPSSEAK
jgi:TrbL/VirB6 plasmid conjugal transfer protein